jgi:cell division initiation protein
MRVTPLDLRQTQFAAALRGYDKHEVRAFLAEAADDYEQALREIDRLKQELLRAEEALGEHREREVHLRNTLLTAQRLADQIRENAEQEARMTIREAEGRADLLLEKAQARLDEVEREIHELKLRRLGADQRPRVRPRKGPGRARGEAAAPPPAQGRGHGSRLAGRRQGRGRLISDARVTPGYVRGRPGGCALAVRVVPRSGRTEISGQRNGAVLVRVAAAPLEGAANAAVVDLLAEVLRVPRRAVTVLRGDKGRDKLLAIDGLSPSVASSRIEAWLQPDASTRGR